MSFGYIPVPVPVSVSLIEPRSCTLDNGLQVLTVELPHLHRVALSVSARVGSRFEAARDGGLSHFLEHMLCRGTEALPTPFLLNGRIEALGGTLHAETREEACLYQIVLPPATAKEGLSILAQMMSAPAFPGIETERRVVLEEALEDYDAKDRDTNLEDLVGRAVWGDHPLAQKIVGLPQTIRRFRKADFARHHQHHYGASNLVLCAAGAIRQADMETWANEALGGLRRGEVVYPMPAPMDLQSEPQRVHVDGDPGAQTDLLVAFRAFGERHPDAPALAILGRILNDGMATRLYQRLVHEKGLAYHVGAYADLLSDCGLYLLGATAAHESVPVLLAEMLGLVAALRDWPVSAAELDTAKRRSAWDAEALGDEPDAVAGWLGRSALYHPPLPMEERLAQVQAVTANDVQRVAQRVFSARRMTVGTVGPLGRRFQAAIDRVIAGA